MSDHPVWGEQSYNQELWVVQKDTVYSAINSLFMALDYMRLYRQTVPEKYGKIIGTIEE